MRDLYRVTVEIDASAEGVAWLHIPGNTHALRIYDIDALNPEKLPREASE